jgi:hypothetical protein
MKHMCNGVTVNAWVQAWVCSGHSDIEAGSSMGNLAFHHQSSFSQCSVFMLTS